MSLRQYALEVLTEHCRQPTVDEWLDGLSRQPRSEPSMSGAEAVRQARQEEDDHLFDVLHRR